MFRKIVLSVAVAAVLIGAESLIARETEAVFALEKDRALSRLLKDLTRDYENVKIIASDVLKADLRKVCRNK